jgi:general secretion pathway protein D
MSPHVPGARRALWLIAAAALALSACATNHLREDGEHMIDAGNYGEGFAKLRAAAEASPDDTKLRQELRLREEQATRRLITAADNERINGHYEDARRLYQQALTVDPRLSRALNGVNQVDQAERHAGRLAQAQELLSKNDREGALAMLRTILDENPQQLEARTLQRKLSEDLARDAIAAPAFRNQARKPVTLEFRDANLKLVFEAIAKSANINVLLDRDVKSDLKTTIFVKDASVEDAIDLLLLQNQLEKKVISDNTLFIYPNLPTKVKDYQDLKIRNFQLTNADAKQVQTMLKTLLKTRDLYVDEKTNSVVMRDTPDAIRLAEKLINSQDLPEPEVLLEVEVLEVNRSNLEQLGINWPTSLALSYAPQPQTVAANVQNGVIISPQTTIPAQPFTLRSLSKITPGQISVGSISGSIDFQRSIGDTNTLSSPRLRVRNKEKAKILIGDRVPVITNSVTPTNGGTSVVTGSVTYLDVGLKLDVEPEVHLDDDVAIKLSLEVSNIAKQITGQGGTIAYQIGTRTANTVLRLKDGETQILAGLISDDDRKSLNGIDGLSQLPVLGRLFGSTNINKSKNEIVLTITPHLIRGVKRPDASDMEFWTGTENTLRTRPAGALTIGKVAQGAGVAAVAAANVANAGTLTAATPAPATPVVAPTSGGAATPATPGTPAVAATAAPAAAGPPVVLSWRAPTTVRVGQEFTVSLLARTGQPVGSLPLGVHFDPAAFSVVRVTEGDFLKAGGAQTSFSNEVDAAGGKITIEASQPGGRGSGGAGTVVSLTLKANGAADKADLSLTSGAPAGPAGAAMNITLPPALSLRVVE